MAVDVVSWHAGVPLCIEPMSAQGGLRDNRHSFETDSKMPPIERPATSWTPEVYSVELVKLSVEQFSLFQHWYVSDIRMGTLPFWFPHPVTGAIGAWKIMKADPPYQVRKVGMIPSGSHRRRISVSFTLMSWPGSVGLRDVL